MNRLRIFLLMLLASLLLTGCGLRTVEQMYCLPKRSQAYSNLQSAIDKAMTGLSYAAPDAGENQQTVQQADLDGDGQEEYLLFARDNVEKSLKILIFDRVGEQYGLIASIDKAGLSFDQVEYVDVDGAPGMEIVVGCGVSDRVLGNLTVYTFRENQPIQLLTENCSKFLTCDFYGDGTWAVVLLGPGETETDRGRAVCWRWENGTMVRSRQAELSGAVADVKRIMVSRLESGETAVYVASAMGESAIITDVLTWKEGSFANISVSAEAETSVQTLRNYDIYADDIDGDGVLELPSLSLGPHSRSITGDQEYMIRWYSLDLAGNQKDKIYSFHNFSGGWYLRLTAQQARSLRVTELDGVYCFRLYDPESGEGDDVLRIYTLVGPNREDQALEDGRFVLYRGDGVLYAAKLEHPAAGLGITQESIINRFHLIHHDWKTGET